MHCESNPGSDNYCVQFRDWYYNAIHGIYEKRYFLIKCIPCNTGGDLLFHSASREVPSACPGLTFVFGMGTGVSLGPLPPDQ